MTALLLAEVETSAQRLVESLSSQGSRQKTVVSATGTGKSAVMRRASEILGDRAVLLEASDDKLSPRALMGRLDAGLAAMGHPLPAIDDADRGVWSNRVRGCASVLRGLGNEGPIVLLDGIDQLKRVAGSGGTPGRHAAEFVELLRDNVPRLTVSTTIGGPPTDATTAIDHRDLGRWLLEETVWGTLAPAASAVAGRGPEWRMLPALTLRLLVALAHLDALPTAAPSTPLEAGRALAVEMAEGRATRSTWAAWQLVARVRGPLDDSALEVLLSDPAMPVGIRNDELLTRCLLFRHDGWHMHPSLREVGRNPPPEIKRPPLPHYIVRQTGRRVVEHFRKEADQRRAEGDRWAAEAAHAAALDACAMAGDDALVERFGEDLPDPYDHVGDMATDDPGCSRLAYEHARTCDTHDATALRGIADAEDRQGTDAAEAERLFREVLALEPQDVASHFRLVGVLLAAGRPGAAADAFNEAVDMLAGVLSEEELARRLCVPIARLAIAAGDLPLASRAVVVARGTLGASEVRELDRLVEGLVETLEYGEFVAARRLGTQWWTAPELLSDFDAGHQPLTRWLAARVDAVQDEAVTLHYADVVRSEAPPAERPERVWTTLALTDLRRLTLDTLPEPLPGTILEVGVYGDGQDQGSTVARVVRTGPLQAPEPALPLDRYVRRPE